MPIEGPFPGGCLSITEECYEDATSTYLQDISRAYEHERTELRRKYVEETSKIETTISTKEDEYSSYTTHAKSIEEKVACLVKELAEAKKGSSMCQEELANLAARRRSLDDKFRDEAHALDQSRQIKIMQAAESQLEKLKNLSPDRSSIVGAKPPESGAHIKEAFDGDKSTSEQSTDSPQGTGSKDLESADTSLELLLSFKIDRSAVHSEPIKNLRMIGMNDARDTRQSTAQGFLRPRVVVGKPELEVSRREAPSAAQDKVLDEKKPAASDGVDLRPPSSFGPEKIPSFETAESSMFVSSPESELDSAIRNSTSQHPAPVNLVLRIQGDIYIQPECMRGVPVGKVDDEHDFYGSQAPKLRAKIKLNIEQAQSRQDIILAKKCLESGDRKELSALSSRIARG